MEDNLSEDVIKIFKSKRNVYENFTRDIKNLIEKLLLTKNIKYDHIESRTKTVESFSEKISRDGKDYQDPINEITDLSGVRIVVYTLKDIDKVSDIIESSFQIDPEKSVDKSRKMKINEFGYLSKHLIVSLNNDRLVLPENTDYANLKAEVQIRTVLQHAWATIEHKINYKPDITLPSEQKRDFYRLSAVLELADKEFQNAIESYEKTKESYKNEIQNNNIATIDLNSDSIMFYLDSTEIKKKMEQFNSIKRLHISFGMSIIPEKHFFKLLKIADINTLEQLSNIINFEESKNNIERVVNIWEKDKEDQKLKLVLSRLTLLRLLVYFNSEVKIKNEIIEEKLLSDGMINLLNHLEEKN